jgi:hypothetical protein
MRVMMRRIYYLIGIDHDHGLDNVRRPNSRPPNSLAVGSRPRQVVECDVGSTASCRIDRLLASSGVSRMAGARVWMIGIMRSNNPPFASVHGRFFHRHDEHRGCRQPRGESVGSFGAT